MTFYLYATATWDGLSTHCKLQLIWIADGKKDTYSDGAKSIVYLADNKDPNDGISRLWVFTRHLKGNPTEFIFKSSNKESHISYDSMLGVGTARLSQGRKPDIPRINRMALLS